MPGDADNFIEFALTGKLDAARDMLRADPDITQSNVWAAAAHGDADALARHRGVANQPGGPRNWVPLLYLCYSDFQRYDVARQGDFLRSAKTLLDAGADPNAFFLSGDDPAGRQTALYGVCGRANRPDMTQLLFDAGADPNEGVASLGSEALYHAAELPDHRCLELILAARPDADKVSYCLGRKLDFDDPEGVRLLLSQGADPNFVSPFGDRMTRVHHGVQRGRNAQIVGMLLDAGGDITVRTATGKTPYALAVRYGRSDVAELLRARGASDAELTRLDRLVGACAMGDPAAESLESIDPIGDAENAVFGVMAAENRVAALHLMLRCGFDVNARGDMGPVLHHAAWTGAADAVAALLQYGPALEQKNNFGGTALATALYGARHCHDPHGGNTAIGRPQDVMHGDYPRVIRFLLDAGADANAPGILPTGDSKLDALLEPYLA